MAQNQSIDGGVLVDFEQFRDSVFFLIKIRGLPFKKTVKDQAAVAAFFKQLEAEREARKAAGQEVNGGTVAVSMPAGVRGGKALSATKALLFSPALESLRSHLNGAKSAICGPAQYGGYANPSGIIDGLFEIHKSLVPRLKADVAEAKRKLHEDWQAKDGTVKPGFLVAFLADYPAAIERARTLPILEGGLGPLFNPGDYPTTAEVEAAFDIERRLVQIEAPNNLTPEEKAAARAELAADMKDAADTIKDALRNGLLSLLQHGKEVLSTKPGEKPKVIKDSLLENVLGFCDTFALRNSQGDDGLAGIVAECKETLSGFSPDKLRKFASVRDDAAAKFGELAGKLDTLVSTQASRKFDLSDD